MQTTLPTHASPAVFAPSRIWTGRVLSGLAVLFLAFDGIAKLVKPAPVLEAFVRLGLPESTAVGIGLLLLACTVLYVIPQTATLGAVLLTGYLGGAIAIHVRAADALFPVVFPFLFGCLVWGGLYLRDARVRFLLPTAR